MPHIYHVSTDYHASVGLLIETVEPWNLPIFDGLHRRIGAVRFRLGRFPRQAGLSASSRKYQVGKSRNLSGPCCSRGGEGRFINKGSKLLGM